MGFYYAKPIGPAPVITFTAKATPRNFVVLLGDTPCVAYRKAQPRRYAPRGSGKKSPSVVSAYGSPDSTRVIKGSSNSKTSWLASDEFDRPIAVLHDGKWRSRMDHSPLLSLPCGGCELAGLGCLCSPVNQYTLSINFSSTPGETLLPCRCAKEIVYVTYRICNGLMNSMMYVIYAIPFVNEYVFELCTARPLPLYILVPRYFIFVSQGRIRG